MQIAVITDTFYTINGVSRTYQELVKYCQKKNVLLDIFTIGKNYHRRKLGSVNIYQFPIYLPIKYYYDLPPFDARIISPELRKVLTQNKYDIIHLATPGSLGIAARIILANDPIPKVGCFHTLVADYAGWWLKDGLKKFPASIKNLLAELSQTAIWKMLVWFYAKSDVVLAPSQEIKKRLKILGRPIAIFPRGVDASLFDPNNRPKKLNHKLPVALYVGRLSTEKNLDLLVKIWQKRKDAELWLVGDGPYQEGLKNQLPQAKFFGWQEGTELSKIYASADFFVFPSTTDTFGNAVLEAQASGLPVIATNSGGPKELIENKINGLIAKPTSKDFNRAIDFLIKDENRRKTMGQSARKAALQKSWPKVFDQLFKVYQELAIDKKLKNNKIRQ